MIGPSLSSPRIARADADRPWVMTQSWHELLFVHWRTDPAFLRRVVERVFEPDETGAQSATSVHATWSIEGPRPITAQSKGHRFADGLMALSSEQAHDDARQAVIIENRNEARALHFQASHLRVSPRRTMTLLAKQPTWAVIQRRRTC